MKNNVNQRKQKKSMKINVDTCKYIRAHKADTTHVIFKTHKATVSYHMAVNWRNIKTTQPMKKIIVSTIVCKAVETS